MAKTKETQTPKFTPAVIHVETTPDGQCVSRTENVNFEMLLRILLPVIVQSAKKVHEAAAESKIPSLGEISPSKLAELKVTMYDMMNIAFSNALDEFAPEIEARPSLSADAILRAQNEILEEEMAKAGYNPTQEEINAAIAAKKAQEVKAE